MPRNTPVPLSAVADTIDKRKETSKALATEKKKLAYENISEYQNTTFRKEAPSILYKLNPGLHSEDFM